MIPVPPELVERVRASLVQGHSYASAGAALGLTVGQVAGIRRRHIGALPTLSPPPEPAPEARHCQWICNDRKPWVWCTEPVDRPGGVWCAGHHKVVYSGRGSWAP
jgi:hypothetical protein